MVMTIADKIEFIMLRNNNNINNLLIIEKISRPLAYCRRIWVNLITPPPDYVTNEGHS